VAEVTDSIIVKAPVEQTFQYLTDHTRALQWMEGMTEFTLLGARATGVGARVRATQRMLGMAISVELRIVEYKENQKVVSVSSGPVRSVSTWQFEPVDGGTRVIFRGDYRLNVPVMVPFADSILKNEVAGHISRSLRNLKAQVEAK
jgi:carbon monoxide dehydrogenase subunit G